MPPPPSSQQPRSLKSQPAYTFVSGSDVVCCIVQVPKEFRLPKSHYRELVFTSADFTRGSDCVIATIFRNIYIWQISNSQLLTTIQVRRSLQFLKQIHNPTA